MVDLNTQESGPDRANLNPTIGSFQGDSSGAATAIRGVGGAISDLFSAKAQGARRGPEVDDGLAAALLSLSPQTQQSMDRDAARLTQAEIQRPSLDLRSRRVALARRYAEANPRAVEQVLHTFQVATGDVAGAEILGIQEDAEAAIQAEQKQWEDRADSLQVPRVGRPAADWQAEVLEADQRNYTATKTAQRLKMLLDNNKIGRDEYLKQYSQKVMPAWVDQAGRSMAVSELNYGTVLTEDGVKLDVQNADPLKLAEDTAAVDQIYSELENALIANLSRTGEFSQQLLDVRLKPAANLRDQAKRYLSGEITKEAYQNVQDVTSAMFNYQIREDNPGLDFVMQLMETMGPVLKVAEDNGSLKPAVRRLLTDALPLALDSASTNFKQLLLDRGITDPKDQRQAYEVTLDFISNAANDEMKRAEQTGNLLRNMVAGAEHEPRLFKTMVEFLAKPESLGLVISGVDSIQNQATQDRVTRGLSTYFDDMKRVYQEEIEELLDTRVRVGTTDLVPSVGPFGAGSRFSESRSVVSFSTDGGVSLNEELLDEVDITQEQIDVLHSALEQVHAKRANDLMPLMQALKVWNAYLGMSPRVQQGQSEGQQ